MKLELSSADYCPPSLHEQLPIVLDVIREMPGPDGPNYFLASVTPAIQWNEKSATKDIDHVVIRARHTGAEIKSGMKNVVVAIYFVTDDSLCRDENFEFSKTDHSAIGIVSDLSAPRLSRSFKFSRL